MEERDISDQEKALVQDWHKRIEVALDRAKDELKRFETNRKLLKGRKSTDSAVRVRANLHFANMAALLPQVYAKDPEYSTQIAAGAPSSKQALLRKFADTADKAITKYLVKDANLKKQAKKILRSVYATSVGWWKLSWQENRRTDPLILNQIKDTQDNIDRLQQLRAELNDESAAVDHDLKVAQLQETLKGLETQQEVRIARGLALDFVMSEDVIVLDESIRTISDYPTAGALAHRVWMTADKFKARFGYEAKKAKSFSEKNGVFSSEDKGRATLLCVWEIWSQDDNRIYYVCTGEPGFCEEPKSPDWTGKRWYPFFLLAFNEIDGSFYPLSDIELTETLVDEYNQNREDFVRDRKGALPLNVVREGGSLTPEDLEKLKNRQGGDIITVKGTPGTALSADIFSGSLGSINPENYDTAPARQDMEMLVGGGDAARGAVLKAKTATEAEIMSQGLRGRSAERTDTLEDLLNEVGPYALEILLRKVSEEEMKTVAGDDAMWPTLTIDEIFDMVSIEVRGGSTGKPNAAQEQDRWLKLLPVIKDAVEQVAKLREAGQYALANAVIELTRETLRRFDERIDIEQFLPPVEAGQDDPGKLKQELLAAQQQLKEVTDRAKAAEDKLEKGYIEAAAQVASSSQPAIASATFESLMARINGAELQDASQPPAGPAAAAAPAMPPPGGMTPPAPTLPPDAPLVSPEPAQLQ